MALDKSSFEIEYLRGGSRQVTSVEHVPGCEHAPTLALSDEVNAWAGRHRVVFTTALMRFLRNDDELAAVVGHELAHNVLKHRWSQRRWEEEADYVGSYFAALGGYDPEHAITLWPRMARRNVDGAVFRSRQSHPTFPARMIALQETILEIRGKVERGESLAPEYQD